MRTILLTGGDGGPCVPAALAVLLDKTYDQVNGWLVYRGYRQPREKKGVYGNSLAVGGTSVDRMNMNSLGLNQIYTDRISVNQFLQSHPTGSFLLRVNGHCLAIKEGIAYDTLGDSSKRIVKQAWQRINNNLPYDFSEGIRLVDQRKINQAKQARAQSQQEKRKEYQKKLKQAAKEKKKDPNFKLEQLLKRQKVWQSKLKKAQTYLKKIGSKIKRIQKQTAAL